MEGTYILVVDDESRMRKLLKDFLSAKGYQILEAEDGEKAVEVFEENRNKIKYINIKFNCNYINYDNINKWGSKKNKCSIRRL